MIAFIVATPLQLFNAVVIMRHFFPTDKCDLYVLKIACDMHRVVERFIDLEIIGDVYYLEDVCQRKSKLGIFWDHIYTSGQQRRLLRDVSQKKYSDMFTTWVGRASTWLFTKLSRNNKRMKLHFYEEGIGVYMRNLSELYNNIKTMYKILRYKFDVDYAEDLYLYEPSLCKGVNTKFKLVRIGNVSEDDIVYMNRSLSEDKIHPYDSKVIFLENEYEGTVFDGLDEHYLIDLVETTIGENNVIIRLHPCSDSNKYTDCGYSIDRNRNISWENLIALEKTLTKNILVTSISTAALSPQLIYGIETKVIYLGLAIRNEYPNSAWAQHFWEGELSEFILSFQNLYTHRDCFAVPKDFSELKQCLIHWCND